MLFRSYLKRKDLQSEFPEARKKNLLGLIDWAAGVVTRAFGDADYDLLLPHSSWYIQQKLKPTKEVREPSRLDKIQKIAAKSSDVIREEGVKRYLVHIRAKITRREFEVAPGEPVSTDDWNMSEEKK